MELAKGSIDIIVKGMGSGIFISHDLNTVPQFFINVIFEDHISTKNNLKENNF